MPFSTFINLVGKLFRATTKKPLQRFNIIERSKKYIGQDSQHFFPAPRAIGSLSQIGPSQYPHLECRDGFKSISERRLKALEIRKRQLLEAENNSDKKLLEMPKSFSETRKDDELVIDAISRLPAIKQIIRIDHPKRTRHKQITGGKDLVAAEKISRPLPKSTNLDLSDHSSVWAVNKVPPGRLDLNKLQELMLNSLADPNYWTPKQIAETYNIKEEYAKNLLTYLRQIRFLVSPRMKYLMDYTNRNNELYQATRDVVYKTDKRLRSELDRSVDETFEITDDLDPNIRDLIEFGRVQKIDAPLKDPATKYRLKKPEPLRVKSLNQPQNVKQQQQQFSQPPKQLNQPVNQPRESTSTPQPNMGVKQGFQQKAQSKT